MENDPFKPNQEQLQHPDATELLFDQAVGQMDQMIAVEGNIPPMSEAETDVSRLQTVRNFFGRRKEQLQNAVDHAFSRNINGLDFSGREMIKARFHPRQLRRNVLSNLGMGHRLDDDAITGNPVLRTATYRKALTGDKKAHGYLRLHDKNYGQEEMTLTDATKEVLAIFSGYAAVRKIGLYAIAGVTIMQSRNATGERLEALQKRGERLIEKDKGQSGRISFEKRKQIVQQVAAKHTKIDPFNDYRP